MDHEILSFFYPHGLGHLMGLDTHDVGGIPLGYERLTKTLAKLRCVRNLEKNMGLIVEAGCYFIEAQTVPSNPVTAKFVSLKMLSRYRGTGGVRIETDVVVTAASMECMSKVPRTVKEIEARM